MLRQPAREDKILAPVKTQVALRLGFFCFLKKEQAGCTGAFLFSVR